jgi:indolepyruvate ferredoxin oxidoreductase
VIARRREFLVDYQNRAYARRYLELVEQVRAAETRAVPGNTQLTESVARNLFKVMAYKDEYEVARLFGDAGFRRALHADFEGELRLRPQFAIPVFSRPDPINGEIRKRSYGPWMLSALRLLAPLKVLRGTPLDVFGRTAERRMERALSADYRRTVAALLPQLRADNHALACQIADLPDQIRGFGPVKQRSADAARERQLQLIKAWPQADATAAVGA